MAATGGCVQGFERCKVDAPDPPGLREAGSKGTDLGELLEDATTSFSGRAALAVGGTDQVSVGGQEGLFPRRVASGLADSGAGVISNSLREDSVDFRASGQCWIS